MTDACSQRRGPSRREALVRTGLGLGWLGAAGLLQAEAEAAGSLAAPRASATGLQLIDFAVRLVSPEQVKAAGYDGVLVYVSELRPGATFDFKPVTREYIRSFRGRFKQKPGEKSVVQELIEERRAEKEKEDRE